MTIRAFLGERFSRTYENQAFDRLYRLLGKHWRDQEERVTLIGNVTCNGHELDALLLKSDAIVVVDFKNQGGRIQFTENGPWLADGIEVRGGAKTNPFKQVQANKFAVMNWLKERCSFLDVSNNLGHIAGLVLFQQKIEFDITQLPPKVASWFNVTDHEGGLVWLSQVASPTIRLDRNAHDRIVAALNVAEFQLPDEEVRVFELPEIRKGAIPQALHPTRDQKQALEKAERLLSSDELHVLMITGMASTGKSALVRGLASLCTGVGRELVALAPNSAVAHDRQRQTGLKWRSIFSHIYEIGAPEDDEDDCRVHPPRACKDPDNAVYVIDEAQLLSNAYFDLGDERFGTGHTISDFLAFTLLPAGKRKLVILGDPYQLSRGGDDYSLLSEGLLKSKGLRIECHSLKHPIDDGSHRQLLSCAVNLVSGIRNDRFSTLDAPATGAEVVCVDGDAKRKSLYELFGQESNSCGVLITFSNQTASQVTSWIRRNLRNYQSEFPQPGDRIELYNQLDRGDGTQRIVMPHGSFGTVVSCSQVAEEHKQALKGRPQPVILRFRKISVQFDHELSEPQDFIYFENFLLAEKPELDQDTSIAKKVFLNSRVEAQLAVDKQKLELLKNDPALADEYERARSRLKQKRTDLRRADPYYNAVGMRYAYASTCHHAQGRKWPDLIIDAGYDGLPRANKGYFRWLYTALTRSTGRVRLANFTPLSPLDKVAWRGSRAAIDVHMKSLFRFLYPKDAALTEGALSKPLPDGFNDTTLALINLWLYVAGRFATKRISILRVKQHPYQEHYVIADEDGNQATISFRYNGQDDVTAIKYLDGDRSVAETALSCLNDPLRFNDPLAQSALEAVTDRLSTNGFNVEGGVPNNWHFRLSVTDSQSRQVAIKVHYSKEGGIGTIEAEKASDLEVLEQLGRVFQPTEESV